MIISHMKDGTLIYAEPEPAFGVSGPQNCQKNFHSPKFLQQFMFLAAPLTLAVPLTRVVVEEAMRITVAVMGRKVQAPVRGAAPTLTSNVSGNGSDWEYRHLYRLKTRPCLGLF